MTPAERQARYRAAHATVTAATVKVRYRKRADRRSRPQRWRDAVAELLELQADYCLDAPKPLHGAPSAFAGHTPAGRRLTFPDLPRLEPQPTCKAGPKGEPG